MPHTWYKVDNVAKVFLASVTRRDPRVFRISCTLTEDIDPDAPEEALFLLPDGSVWDVS